MDYKIRNAQQTISPELRAKAKELAQNTVKDGARKTTDNEILQLVQVANKDGVVSEEELKFIAAQASSSSLAQLEKANFQPVSNEFQHTQDFTSDNNLHFWSHAYLAYNVMSSTTGSETQARDLSAYMGASYELSHFDERQGNSALKDIVMNAYGAEFGIQLFKDPTTRLPGRFEGPQVENRRDFPDH